MSRGHTDKPCLLPENPLSVLPEAKTENGQAGARQWWLEYEHPGCQAPTSKILADQGHVNALSLSLDMGPGNGGEVPG